MNEQEEVVCPKCGGRMWDNRDSKRNPKSPDFKCRQRACDGVIWPSRFPQESAPPSRQVVPQRPAAQPPEFGHIPRLDWNEEVPPDDVPVSIGGAELAAMFKLYDTCVSHVVHVTCRYEGFEGQIASMAATLFIEANHRGIVL